MTWSGYSEKGQGSQERGPGSFANSVGGHVVKQGAGAEVGGNVNTSVRFVGNGTRSVGQVTPGQLNLPTPASVADGTLQLMMQLGQKTLAPRIAAIKAEAEVDGAVRHASGVAMAEIVNEQPWYANVFGTAPAVEGARAYAAKTGAATFVQSNLENMEQLGQQSPEAFGKILAEQMGKTSTGDPDTDAVVRGELAAQIPLLVKAHTKAHVAYMQKKADEAALGSMTAAAKKYGAVMSDPDLMSVADNDAAELELVDSFRLTEGRNPASHWNNVAKVVVDQAIAGNGQFIRVAQQAGVIDALPVEYRDIVKAGMTKAAPSIFAKALVGDTAMMTAVASMFTNPPETPEEIAAAWALINAQMSSRTGLPEEWVQFRGGDQVVDSIAFDQRRDMQEEKAQLTAVGSQMAKDKAALQKEQDSQLRVGLYLQALGKDFDNPAVNMSASNGNLRDTYGLTEKEEVQAWNAFLNTADAPKFGKLINRMPKASNTAVKSRMQALTTAAARPQDKEAWMAAWTQLVQVASEVPDERTLAMHAGQAEAADIKSVQTMMASGLDMLTAITISTREAPARRAAAKLRAGSADDREEVTSYVEDRLNTSMGLSQAFRFIRGVTGGRKPDSYQVSLLAGIVSGLDTGMLSTPEASRTVGLNQLEADGNLTIGGGGFVFNMDARDAIDAPLYKVIGLGSPGLRNDVQEALQVEALEQLKKVGYGNVRSVMDSINYAARFITNPVQGGQINSLLPSGKGFEASGFTITRLPRSKGVNQIDYTVNYQENGVPKHIIITSADVKTRYNAVIAASRKPANVGGVPIDEIGTDSIIAPAGGIN